MPVTLLYGRKRARVTAVHVPACLHSFPQSLKEVRSPSLQPTPAQADYQAQP